MKWPKRRTKQTFLSPIATSCLNQKIASPSKTSFSLQNPSPHLSLDLLSIFAPAYLVSDSKDRRKREQMMEADGVCVPPIRCSGVCFRCGGCSRRPGSLVCVSAQHHCSHLSCCHIHCVEAAAEQNQASIQGDWTPSVKGFLQSTGARL